MRTQRKGSRRGSICLPTQHITVENTGRNTDGNGHSDGVSEMRNMLSETEGKVILVESSKELD